MNVKVFPWRRVTEWRLQQIVAPASVDDSYLQPGRYYLTLECGHQVVTRKSGGLPRKVRCRICWYNEGLKK